jgi:hypothetical protein
MIKNIPYVMSLNIVFVYLYRGASQYFIGNALCETSIDVPALLR